uniref:Uncharacterized protein n=1 Tax=Desulfobacca acetoxidans TaxID=60893 RepID=A0A7C3V3D6_9BACT
MNVKKLDEKKQLEFYAVLYFIRDQRKNHRRWLIFKEFSEPPNPDTYCLLNGEQIGVEVTHLCGNNHDAKKLLGRMNHQADSGVPAPPEPVNHRLPHELNRILDYKAKHQYGDKTWLVIRNTYPLWMKSDFETYWDDIIVPRGHAFEEIWLLCDPVGASGTLRLYP